MYLFSADDIRLADRKAVDHFGIPPIILMENAARGVAEIVEDRFPAASRILVACGGGNNGGDGLAAARHLLKRGRKVTVLLAAAAEKLTPAGSLNLKILKRIGCPIARSEELTDVGMRELAMGQDILVDALLGSGSKGAPRGETGRVICAVRGTVPVVSIDIPSGVDPSTGEVEGDALAEVAPALAVDRVPLGLQQQPEPFDVGERLPALRLLALIGELQKVGADRAAGVVDVRVIAATNRNLPEMIAQGSFREDLYYRLNVIHLHIPPLRERRRDIDLLVQYFLDKYNRIFRTNVHNVSAEVREIFYDHDWPGNVRELENVIERGINFARGDVIERHDLPQYLREKTHRPHARTESPPGRHMLKSIREHHEREIVLRALEQARGNKAQAARLLGISRSWLYEKMKTMGISAERHSF